MTDITKIALVTGASRGLGYATALQLSDSGYHIIAVERTMGGLEELADIIEGNGKTIDDHENRIRDLERAPR